MPRELVWAHSQVQEIIHLQTTAAEGKLEKGPAGGGVPQRRTERLRCRRALRAASPLETRSHSAIHLFLLHPRQFLRLTTGLRSKGSEDLHIFILHIRP